MKRQALDDGRWFNRETAKVYDETTTWDGRNHISKATGTQWDHQRLYRTKQGTWVLHCWSQWEGRAESWEEIDNDSAARWLSKNGYDSSEDCQAEFAALEV